MRVQSLSSAGYAPGPPVSENWHLTKPAADGRRGIVVAQARPGAEAGIAILEAGGNAVDAAVATALALASQEPWNSGLGGYGGYAVVHRAGQPVAEVVDFGPVAPRNLSPASFALTGGMSSQGFQWPEVVGDANIHGPLAVAVPNAVAGLEKLHSSWGRLPLSEVMVPSIALARRGLLLDWFTTLKLATCAADLRRYPESARIYLRDGLPPVPPAQGDAGFMPLGNLAGTLEQLSRAGLRDFYDGEVAAAFVRDQARVGGVIDATDLRNCAARIVPAMQVPWRNGRTLQLAPGMTAAPTLRDVMRTMIDAPHAGKPDAAWYRLLAAEMRAAFAARLDGLGAAEAPEPPGRETCTTHISVCDTAGTMVSLTTTLMANMGSRVVLPETGILLNNGVMLFDPRPGRPNSLAAGKRALTNMCPVVMRDGDRPILAAGAAGGRHIMAAVFQLMAYVADFGMAPQEAAGYPRIDVAGPDKVSADIALDHEIIAALAGDAPTATVARGIIPGNFASPNLILQRADGTRTGVSDDRSPWAVALAQ